MRHELLLVRDKYSAQTTLGKLSIEGKYFCETLEDTVRPANVKVQDHTAIPSGRYQVTVNHSTRFQRDMPLIYNQIGLTLVSGGIRFAGIRMHGGNTHLNTSGCPLVAFTRVNETSIQGSAEKALTEKLVELLKTGDCFITIINLSQI